MGWAIVLTPSFWLCRRAPRVAITAALVCVGFSACGGTSDHAMVIRVGNVTIKKAEVDRWTTVVERGGAFMGFRGQPQNGTPRRRALALLISSNWLIAEAARRGVPVTDEAIDEVLAERGEGEAELHKRLASHGQTLAGLKLELKAELALAAIREQLSRRARQFTAADVEGFYRENHELFSAPGARLVDIIEGIPSVQAASDLVRRIGTGSGFTKRADRKRLDKTTGVLLGPASKKEVDYAIYAARPGVVSKPMPLGDAWAVFIVREIIPPRPQPFAEVRREAAARLRLQRAKELTTTFNREYRAYWTPRTDCTSGYIVPGCAQSHAQLEGYEDPFSKPEQLPET